MSQLAAGIAVPLSTASRIVDRLVKKGLAARAPVRGDRRVVQVRFSRRGSLINRYVLDWRRSTASDVLEVLPAHERARLLDALARMSAAESSSSSRD